jgi:hypothetical protein
MGIHELEITNASTGSEVKQLLSAASGQPTEVLTICHNGKVGFDDHDVDDDDDLHPVLLQKGSSFGLMYG